jgi:ATP-independent RNA helicase DbpA
MANQFEELKLVDIEKAAQVKLIRGNLGFENQPGLGQAFQTAKMKTIMISGGKKDKLGRGDLLGALTSDPHALLPANIGKIELFDRSAFVAVAFDQAEQALKKLQVSKIKGAKFKSYLVEP